MLREAPQVNDIIKGWDCGVCASKGPDGRSLDLFKVLSITERGSPKDWYLKTLRFSDRTEQGFNLWMDQPNWDIVKRNGRTICKLCL